MKILIFLLAFFAASLIAFPQQPSWVYQVNYEPIKVNNDSVTPYTKVFVNLNESVVRDSARLVLKIGSSPDTSDIYIKEYIFTPDIVSNSEVTRNSGITRFYLGDYAISGTKPFIVSLTIE